MANLTVPNHYNRAKVFLVKAHAELQAAIELLEAPTPRKPISRALSLVRRPKVRRVA